MTIALIGLTLNDITFILNTNFMHLKNVNFYSIYQLAIPGLLRVIKYI